MADFDLIIRLVMKQYKGVYFNRIYTTYKVGEQLADTPSLGEHDAKLIFKKNYGSLYPLDDETLGRMVKISDFPQELLDKFVTRFPEADKELFYQRCQQMKEMRLMALRQQQEQ